jgi:FAS-associated factor 2
MVKDGPMNPFTTAPGLVSLAGNRLEPQAAAVLFREEFEARYGEQSGPEWQDLSWEDSSRQAHTQFKFLFVYLHSPNHQVDLL